MSIEVKKRIADAITASGKSMRAISLASGMSEDAVRGVLRHPTNSPTIETILKLAKGLGVSPEWLAFNLGEESAPVSKIPIISWVSAGSFQTTETALEVSDCPTIEMPAMGNGYWFALRVEGDSMDRISPPGSIILVDTSDRKLIPNGLYVIATEEGEATYKRFRPSPDRFEPVSVNTAHEPIFPDGAVRVIGRVRRTILDT